MGRRRRHTDKNVVIVDLQRKCIGFLSRTYVGKTHDKKIADSEGISYPPKAELYKDTGFQGYEPAVTRTCQAKKKPPRGELTAAEKRTNRKLARIRVNVEHALAGVKRSRIVKDVLRNTKDGVSDSAMEAACGLHNLRVPEPQAATETVAKSLFLIKSIGEQSTMPPAFDSRGWFTSGWERDGDPVRSASLATWVCKRSGKPADPDGQNAKAFPFWTAHDPNASEPHLPVPLPPAPARTGPSLTTPGVGGDWSTAACPHDRLNPGDPHISQ